MVKTSALIFVLLTAFSLSAQPNNEELNALLQQSRQEIAQGRFADAEADLSKLIEKAHKKHRPTFELLGYEAFSSLKEKQNDPDAAEQSLNKALAVTGLSSPLPALLDLQAFYARHKLYSKEADTFSKIIAVWSSSVDPNSPGVARYTSLLGGLYFDMGKNEEAEASLRSAVAILDKGGYPDAANAAKRTLLKVLMKEEKREEVAKLIPSMNPDPPKRERPDGAPPVVAPRLISKIEPSYSEEARKLRLSGSVAISLEVDEKGIPTNIKVIGPLGVGLDESAVEAVSTWRFNPGTVGEKPVVVQAVVEVSFRLL